MENTNTKRISKKQCGLLIALLAGISLIFILKKRS